MYSAGFGSKGLTLIFFKKKLKLDGKPETGRQSLVRFVCGCQLSECEANLTSLFFFYPCFQAKSACNTKSARRESCELQLCWQDLRLEI